MMGTLDYMAPEQFTDSHQVDIRADIYSLGATLYKLLCDEVPFAGEQYNTTAKRLAALAAEPLPMIRQQRPDVPQELESVLNRMLAQDPQARYAEPREVVDALSPFTPDCDLRGLVEKALSTEDSTARGRIVDTQVVRSSPPVGTKPSRTQKSPAFRLARRKWMILASIAGVAAALAIAILIFFKTGEGTLVLEINEPGATVTIDGGRVRVEARGSELTVSVGNHVLKAVKSGFRSATSSFSIDWRGGTAKLTVLLNEHGWPHEGQNLWQTNFYPTPSQQSIDKLGFTVLWKKRLGVLPRTADLDGDDDLEITYMENTGRRRALVTVDKNGRELWRKDPVEDSGVTDPDAQTAMVYDLGDVDGDVDFEIVVNVNCDVSWTTNKPNHILIYDGNGTSRGFPVEDGAWAYPVVADVTGDGVPEIVIGLADFRSDHGVYLYRLDGTLIGNARSGEGLAVQAIVDLDMDGTNEILSCSFGSRNKQPAVNGIDDRHAYAIAVEGNGELMWVSQLGTRGSSVFVADLSGTGKGDIVALRRQDVEGPNEVHLLNNKTGRFVGEYMFRGSFHGPENMEWTNWVAADLNRDGRQEIVLGNSDGNLRVLDAKLELIGERPWPESVEPFAANDLDGDGVVDLVVGAGRSLYVLHADLQTACVIDLGGPALDAIISDINLDGRNDILVQTGESLSLLQSQDAP
jgi:hypothetical protein